jgi:hypothetical protein
MCCVEELKMKKIYEFRDGRGERRENRWGGKKQVNKRE